MKTRQDFLNNQEYARYLHTQSTLKNPPSAETIRGRMTRANHPTDEAKILDIINTPIQTKPGRKHPYVTYWKI